MKLLICLLGVLLCCGFAQGQGLVSTPVQLCQPGVSHKSPSQGLSLNYGLRPGFRMGEELSSQRASVVDHLASFDFKIKVPVILKENFKLIVGWHRANEEYEFATVQQGTYAPYFASLDEKDLNTNRFTIYAIKPLNSSMYTLFRGEVSHQGDYDNFFNFENRYATYRAAGVVGFKKRDDLEYGFGLLYSKSFRNEFLLPFGFYNQTFNDKWGVEATIPIKMNVRHNISSKSLVLFGTEWNSRSHSIDFLSSNTEIPQILHLRRASIQGVVDYQKELVPWVWLNLKAGYNFNLNTKVEDPLLNETYRIALTDGAFVHFGIFVSPSGRKK